MKKIIVATFAIVAFAGAVRADVPSTEYVKANFVSNESATVSADANVVKAANTVGQNLDALDSAVKDASDAANTGVSVATASGVGNVITSLTAEGKTITPTMGVVKIPVGDVTSPSSYANIWVGESE